MNRWGWAAARRRRPSTSAPTARSCTARRATTQVRQKNDGGMGGRGATAMVVQLERWLTRGAGTTVERRNDDIKKKQWLMERELCLKGATIEAADNY